MGPLISSRSSSFAPFRSLHALFLDDHSQLFQALSSPRRHDTMNSASPTCPFSATVKRANRECGRAADASMRLAAARVCPSVPGISFQTSSHSTLLARRSCPVQFITQVNVTFILAMTLMFFSTCHSRLGIIPCVVCFVLHVLQSSGTHGGAHGATANSA